MSSISAFLSFRWKLLLTFGSSIPNYFDNTEGTVVMNLERNLSPQTAKPAAPPGYKTLKASAIIFFGSGVIYKHKLAM